MSRSVQTPSKAFAFPNEWQPVRLGSIGKTYGGLTGKSGEDFNTGSASYLTFMQVMGNSRLREPAKGTVNINPGERQNHVQKDDLLFNGSSETPEEVALAAAVDFHPDSDTFLNSFCFGFRLLPDAPADSLFLAYLFRSSVGRNLVSSLAQGATRYNISKTQLLNQAIHLPPKAEQIAIREKLTDAEELINSLERLISKKQAIKQGLMQELLTGRRRLQGFSKSWQATTFGDLVRIQRGSVLTRAQAGSGRIPVVAGGKTPAGYTDKANRVGRTITISASGASAGYVALYNEPIFASDCSTISSSRHYDLDFIYYNLLLRQDDIYRTQTGGAQPHIHACDVYPMEIRVPTDMQEQIAIAQVLVDADKEIMALERRLESARGIKQGMMQELLTGRTKLVPEGVR